MVQRGGLDEGLGIVLATPCEGESVRPRSPLAGRTAPNRNRTSASSLAFTLNGKLRCLKKVQQTTHYSALLTYRSVRRRDWSCRMGSPGIASGTFLASQSNHGLERELTTRPLWRTLIPVLSAAALSTKLETSGRPKCDTARRGSRQEDRAT